ncbi:MAG: histone deacetylase family protein [Pseudomonadota bacterium]
MQAFLDERQRLHAPKNFMSAGRLRLSPEDPYRVDILKSGAMAAGCAFAAPEDAGMAPIEAVHDAAYMTFLQTIHARWQELPGAADEVIPNVHPRARGDGYPSGAVGQAGFHQADTACPISAHTWGSAYWSAQTAIAATRAVLGGAPAAYALCRPPGHHAYADQAGGFCFLNNSAIAAQHLLEAGRRPAILDVDVHHGNGTQGIFYTRGDVLTVSIHADPTAFYPFFWGYAGEIGDGDGTGGNLNLPLAMGSGTDEMLAALDKSFEAIRAFRADVIVVALGLDAHEADPFQALKVTTPGFERMAQAVAGQGLSLVCVQEGGYVSNALGEAATAFLGGLE